MFRKILLYGLPVYLYGLEFLLRQIAKTHSDSLAGPTLAGAGIGFLLPLTELKKVTLDPSLLAQLAASKLQVYSPPDKSFSDFVWVAFFMSLGAWMFSIYLTMQPMGVHTGATNWPLLIGCIIFIVAIVLTEIKERI